ncbi:MAG: hypothetical protein UV92_C0015G0009 [Parcubacteria group bacterium GW2011_GWA1_43_27]|nr:MAG: hypothetical protein UV92_C0015G0009 [Parcubacteria group bacterium GW2011_GWA1_43_27]HCM45515.1 hypothetical protein [Candidatus Veblenbacteria bacterium]
METVEQSQTNPIVRFFSDITTKKAILIISILGIIVFGNSLGNGFVIDDIPQLIEYPAMQQLSNTGDFFRNAIFVNYTYYKPIFSTLNSLIFTLFGPNPVAFHSFSIFLHLAVTSLLFLILGNFFTKPLSLVLSLIYLVHPLNSEVVFYVSDLQDSLFMLFGLLGLYKMTKAKSVGSLVAVAGLLFLSVLCKETGVLFFLMALTYTLLYKREFFWQLLGVSSFTGLIYLALRFKVVGFLNLPLNTLIADLDFSQRLLHIPAILFFYLKTFIFPLNLSVSWQWIIDSPDLYNFYLPLLSVLLVLGLIIYFGFKLYQDHQTTHCQVYIFFSIWLIIGLALHMQIVPLDATVADRWFYFPMVGVIGIIGTLAQAYNLNLSNKYILTVMVIVLILLSARTFIRSFDWRDELTLSLHDAQVAKSHTLEATLSSNLVKLGEFDSAVIHASRALDIYPGFISYHVLGNAYIYSGDYDQAIAAYESALILLQDPRHYEDLSFAYLIADYLSKAERFTEGALKKNPDSARLWKNYAIIEYKLGKFAEAKSAAINMFKLDPGPQFKVLYDAIMGGRQDLKFNLVP